MNQVLSFDFHIPSNFEMKLCKRLSLVVLTAALMAMPTLAFVTKIKTISSSPSSVISSTLRDSHRVSSSQIRQYPLDRSHSLLFMTSGVPTDTSPWSTNQTQTTQTTARVAFLAGSAPSGYGATSPLPDPSWSQVVTQLAKRLPNFVNIDVEEDERVVTQALDLSSNDRTTDNLHPDTNIIVALGIATPQEQERLSRVLSTLTTKESVKALLCDPTCHANVREEQQFAGEYRLSSSNAFSKLFLQVAPWTTYASHARLLAKTQTLLARKSSEDYIFAVLFALHGLVMPVEVLKSDINPSWEKGILRNAQEFTKMVNCCGPQIQAALTDPKSKEAIDLLNSLDLRDQVGSYRVIVSYETPQLEDFTLCILQRNNCFNCASPILKQPQVPVLQQWQGKPLTQVGARQILMGHLKHSESLKSTSNQEDFSWKIVAGANPAYDAFPMQHQTFYPSSNGKSQAMWYDPVFCVETLEGNKIWCQRHYRCIPRQHWSGQTAGAWTLTTLDNGMVSEEHWTTVDADDDLEWAVLHYSGAARKAGQSYVGALLCTKDGHWPSSAPPGSPTWERIQQAFRHCDLELWELFGGSYEKSFMWSSEYTEWAKTHPPPLQQIGDMSITKWREAMRKKETTLQNS